MALKMKDLQKMDVDELEKKAKEIRKELIFEKGPKRASLKKSLARIMTLLHQKKKHV